MKGTAILEYDVLRITLATLAILAGNSAAATTITLINGDDDCFGLLTPCAAGDMLDVGTAFDNATASDPADQDRFGVLGSITTTFTLDQSTVDDAMSATFSFKAVGLDLIDFFGELGDPFEGARIMLNGTDIATFATPFGPGRVAQPVFNIAPSSLSITNVFTITPEEAFEPLGRFENYAIDFARLDVNLDAVGPPPPPPPPPSPVPLPASGMLLLAGFGGLVALRRRTSRTG